MTLRFTTTRAIGVAIALTIGAGSAAAQTTGTTSGTPGSTNTPTGTNSSAGTTTNAGPTTMGGTTGGSGAGNGGTTGTTTGTSSGTIAPGSPGYPMGSALPEPARTTTQPAPASTSVGGTTPSATMGGTPVNGSMNGSVSGSSNGAVNGSMNGSVNGSSMNGSMNGSSSGMGNSMSGSSSMSGSMSGSSMSGSSTSGSSSYGTRSGVRVRKDQGMTSSSSGEVAPAPAPAPAPVYEPAPAPAPAPEPVVTTTVETTTTTTTTEAALPAPTRPGLRFGNGFYFGLGAGANFPQNNIRTAYEPGVNGVAQLGWDPTNSPLGLRLNVGYNRLNGKELLQNAGTTTETTVSLRDADLFSAFADAKLRLPFGRFLGATSGLYAVGGGGVTFFRNYQNFSNVTGTNPGSSVIDVRGDNVTRFALNGGAGLDWGIGNVSLFAEGRYVRVFTQGRDTDFIPVTLGIRFH